VLQFRQFDGNSQKTIGRDGERGRRRDRGDGVETGAQRGSGPVSKQAISMALCDSCCGGGTLGARYRCAAIDERDSSRYGSVLGGGLQ